MEDENPIRTLGNYSKPSHEGYRNTIELPVWNNGVPLRSDTIRLVQNGCSFHGLWSEDPNQHLKDFLKLVDSLDLVGENRERTRGKLRDRNAKESWALLEDLALYDNEIWNDSRDFAKPVKAIALPQDVPSTSDLCLIELENQVQGLMEAHSALTQPTQVNKITTLCKICSGPHDTQYCMEDLEQAFVEYHPRLSMKREDPKTPLLVGRGFLATANAVIDCRIAKIVVGEGITRSIFREKGVDLGEEEAPYWTTLGKRESYKLRLRSDGVGPRTPYYARKDSKTAIYPENEKLLEMSNSILLRTP
nr:MAK10-like protein [Tanacetum cinerariifolium]